MYCIYIVIYIYIYILYTYIYISMTYCSSYGHCRAHVAFRKKSSKILLVAKFSQLNASLESVEENLPPEWVLNWESSQHLSKKPYLKCEYTACLDLYLYLYLYNLKHIKH